MRNGSKEGLFKTEEDVWIKFTPIWFRFLEWIILIGLFDYLAVITNHWAINFIKYLSYITFGMYIQSLLFCVDYTYIKNRKTKYIFALLLATILTTLLGIFIAISINQIKEYL